MWGIKDATISGFNEYLDGLKRREEKVLFSFTLFDTNVTRVCTLKPVKEVKTLTKNTYDTNGNTALYDAVVETVEDVASKLDELRGKVAILNVVMTDGQENSSIKHNSGCLKDLMKKLEAEKRWTFVFLGANQDSWANTQNVGFARGNVVDFTFSGSGIGGSFKSLSQNTAHYMSAMSVSGMGGGDLKSDNFFQGNEKITGEGK